MNWNIVMIQGARVVTLLSGCLHLMQNAFIVEKQTNTNLALLRTVVLSSVVVKLESSTEVTAALS